MKEKKLNLGQLIDEEKRMILDAEKKYGIYFNNTFNLISLSHEFIKETKSEALISSLFLSQFRKHLVLALFSTLRLHHVQAMLDLRIVIESGLDAAYAIGIGHIEDFVIKTADDKLIAPEKLRKRRYKWLENNYPKGNSAIKKSKKIINMSSAHSNIVYAFNNWELIEREKIVNLFYFDKEKDKFIKSDLHFIGNIAISLMDLFYGVNLDYNVITFSSTFISKLKEYEKINLGLKQEILLMPKIQP